jgi:hypothetical protein
VARFDPVHAVVAAARQPHAVTDVNEPEAPVHRSKASASAAARLVDDADCRALDDDVEATGMRLITAARRYAPDMAAPSLPPFHELEAEIMEDTWRQGESALVHFARQMSQRKPECRHAIRLLARRG